MKCDFCKGWQRWVVRAGWMGWGVVSALLLVGCGGTASLMEVNTFELKGVTESHLEWNALVRAERQRRLYGAVSAEQRRAREGSYYQVRWRGMSGREPVRVRFFYRVAATGAQVHELERRVGPRDCGEVEFALLGEERRRQGRVLSWRVELWEGAVLRAEEQSYLWK